MINDIMQKYDICVLVGTNSQGKSTILSNFKKNNNDNAILISNEVKASEYIKNSASNSPLIQWLEKLIDIGEIQTKINEQLNSIKLDDINDISNVNISLKSSAEDYKGLVSVNINTVSNKWEKPGSGETFLAELLLVRKMLNPKIKNPIQYLIIDEPETFLHPSLFVKVASLLKDISMYTKVLIATHSPSFLECFVTDLGSIVYVKNGETKLIPNNEECLEIFKKMPFYNKILNYSDDELKTTKSCFKDIRGIINNFGSYFDVFLKPKIIHSLFAKTVVIGEGRAEKILFDCLKKEKGNTYLSDIEFIELYGKELMPYFANLMAIIGIETIIIFDEDKNHTDEFNLGLNAELHLYENISFDYDIENYLGILRNKNDRNFKSIVSPISIYQLYFNRDKKVIDLINKIDKKLLNSIK